MRLPSVVPRSFARTARVAIVTVSVLVLFEIAYVIGANAFLASAWSRSLANRRPERFSIEWQRAWSWVPGIVDVRAIEIRVQSRRVQWYATADRTRLNVQLFPLAFRHFHARSVHGHGVTFLLRRRLDTIPGSVPSTEGWPEIPGLENPPAVPPERTRSSRPGPGWRITIDGSRLDDVRQVSIDAVSVQGVGWAEGRLRTQLGRFVEIDHAAFHMPDAAFHVGGRTVSDAIALDVEVGFERFAPRGATWRAVWPLLTGGLRCNGAVDSFSFLNLYFERAPWLSLDGSGSLAMDLEFERGRLLPQSRIDADARELSLRVMAHEVRGSGRIRGWVERSPRPTGKLTVDLLRFELRRSDVDSPYARGAGFRFIAESDGTDFSHGLPQLRLILELPESRVARFEVYGDYLPASSGFRLLSGAGEMAGRVELSTETMTGRGELALEGRGIRGRFESLPLSGDVHLHMQLAPAVETTGRTTPAFTLAKARLEFRRVLAGRAESASPGWWGTFDLDGGTLASKPLLLSTPFVARLKDTRPVLAVFAERKRWVALFANFLTVEDVRARGSILLDEDSIVIDRLQIDAEKMELLADLSLSKAGKRGILFARRGVIQFALELQPDGRAWKLVGARTWFEKRRSERALSTDRR